MIFLWRGRMIFVEGEEDILWRGRMIFVEGE